jgi:quercetin dioxygenase-like cupin family protein
VWFVVGNKDINAASKLWKEKGEERWEEEREKDKKVSRTEKETAKKGKESEKEKEKPNLYTDNFFMNPEVLATASFVTYVIKQNEGDFVFLPPNVPHQVANMVTLPPSSPHLPLRSYFILFFHFLFVWGKCIP